MTLEKIYLSTLSTDEIFKRVIRDVEEDDIQKNTIKEFALRKDAIAVCDRYVGVDGNKLYDSIFYLADCDKKDAKETYRDALDNVKEILENASRNINRER